MMIGMMTMIKIILIFFTILTTFSLYSSYSGTGLEEIKQELPHSNRITSSRSYSSGGWNFGK